MPFFEGGTPDTPIQRFTAQADNAPNMGFAIWIPPGEPFIATDKYEQIYNPHGKPSDNPGQADASGSKSVTWPYQLVTAKELRTSSTDQVTTGRVVILAIACLADNVPASTDTAATVVYRLPGVGSPQLLNEPPPSGLNANRLARLARTACQAVV